MSFHVEDSELQQHAKDGARIVGPTKPAAPAVAPEPAKPTEMQELTAAMKAMAESVAAAMDRVADAPDVHVAAPKIVINPELKVREHRKFKLEVTERDNTYERRIKTLTIEAVD